MELRPEQPTAGGFCSAQGNAGGKILLESFGEETTLALILVKISDWLSVSPPKLSPGGWEETGKVSIAKSRSLHELPG